MILVTGATGTVGRALVDRLAALGAPVRAATRRPDRADLPADVDVAYADLGEPDSLDGALKGIQKVFLLADGPNIPAHDANLARAAARAGVDTVVKLSSGRAADPTADDPVPRWHRAGEQAVLDSELAWIFLRPMGFMSNVLAWAGSIRRDRTVRAPFADGRVAVIDPADIAAVAARVLTEEGHEGRAYLLTGPEALSPGDLTATLAEVLEVPLTFTEVSPEAAREAILEHGVSEAMADAITALRAASLEEFTSTVTPAVEQITGRPATSFRAWAERHRDEFRHA
ncbi:NAD(P)H-binding protein [Kitasatospora aureofaciens]|uniref:NAD(P)H-binding protein n=1 Tax=Kitasatospora aureofaciens TaxID=1894 RepID=UPI001C439128|nr:NAD(P)H-binding protein [Kitasatospora aureofaciens]MBV6703063.1 NAD(P)H-binding protein [Kitasatospora aureofaciens]